MLVCGFQICVLVLNESVGESLGVVELCVCPNNDLLVGQDCFLRKLGSTESESLSHHTHFV